MLNYKTYEVVKEIKLNITDTTICQGMILSTNEDHLFFKIQGLYPSSPFGFVIYDIIRDKVENMFFVELNVSEPAYFISAQNNFTAGLVFVHFRDFGTYSIDLFEQRVKEFISNEHDFVLDKRIYHSPDGKWTVAHKDWNGDIKGNYSELEFYTASSYLHNLQFVINQNDKDSIAIYDFKFSEDNRLFITYQLSGGRSRDKESYFGSYDLNTKKLFRSSLKFPWSLNGYYLAYNAKRNETYTLSSYGQFYVIDLDSYSIIDSINLSVRGEQSPILITPDENFAFVAYPNSNSVIVIDLSSKQVIKRIKLSEPYNMIIP
jgi:DNA-binding beta-propeller fold protein YncE